MGDATGVIAGGTGTGTGLLAKERIFAGAGFNRWLVPPAALCIHLCIGMAYGFSVFWLPLSRAIGLKQSLACPADMSFISQDLFATTCDWKISELGWMYTLFFVFLGGAAAIWGGWLEHAGPRKAGFVAAIVLVRRAGHFGAIGIYTHQLWLMWLGPGMHRRDRARAWLYLARVDADQVVSGSPRHGDRHGDHGLWRRRDDRRTARRHADEIFRYADLGGRLGDVSRVWRRSISCS